MSDEIASQLRANDRYVYLSSSTNVQPFDQQYFFRISLYDTTNDVHLIQFPNQNFVLTELMTFRDTLDSFQRLNQAKNTF